MGLSGHTWPSKGGGNGFDEYWRIGICMGGGGGEA